MTYANLHVFFFFRHVETRYFSVAKLNFRQIFETQKHATGIAIEKGLLREKTISSRAKIQTCTLPLGQYAKFQWIPKPPFGLVACTFVLFSDNLSRISCILKQLFALVSVASGGKLSCTRTNKNRKDNFCFILAKWITRNWTPKKTLYRLN